MKQFTTIEKPDTAILYALELASSISVLLLAFWLIASMALRAGIRKVGAVRQEVKRFASVSIPSVRALCQELYCS